MKKQIMILAVSAFALSAIAQETNEFAPRKGKQNPSGYQEQEGEKKKHQQHRLQLMERELKRIGVTEEERAQITELQKSHRKKMQANAKQTAIARQNLSKLQDEGAPMERLEAAIQGVSAAQTEQLRILVENRIEMERILGREKYAKFMQNARTQFQKHGRRGGSPLPPRPELPQIPGQQDSKMPPVPETQPYSEN